MAAKVQAHTVPSLVLTLRLETWDQRDVLALKVNQSLPSAGRRPGRPPSRRVPQMVAEGMLTLSSSPVVILLLINLLLLFIGTFMETVASIIILVPVLLPVLQTIGVDPLHFGIVIVVNLAIGMVTPP